MQRRPKDEGSVYKDKHGVWWAQLDMGRDENGKRKRPKRSADTRTEARRKLGELKAELHRTGIVGRQDITVEQVLRDLLAHPPAEWRSHITIRVRTGHAEVIIRMIGAKRLAKLTVRDVETMLGKLAADGYSSSYLEQVRSVLAKAIWRAERDDLTGRNVAKLAEVPDGPRRQSSAMTPEQVNKLLALDLTPWWRAYILTDATMGLRPGEMLGLRWEDVDLDEGILRVRTSLKKSDPAEPGDSRKVAGLKTKHSKRTVGSMPGPTRDALRAHRKVQAADRLRLGEHYGDSGLVFATAAGHHHWDEMVRQQFNRLCAEAGIGHWQLRELRHTYVSQLSDAGVDVEVISDAVGHKNSTITRNVYLHQLADVISLRVT